MLYFYDTVGLGCILRAVSPFSRVCWRRDCKRKIIHWTALSGSKVKTSLLLPFEPDHAIQDPTSDQEAPFLFNLFLSKESISRHSFVPDQVLISAFTSFCKPDPASPGNSTRSKLKSDGDSFLEKTLIRSQIVAQHQKLICFFHDNRFLVKMINLSSLLKIKMKHIHSINWQEIKPPNSNFFTPFLTCHFPLLLHGILTLAPRHTSFYLNSFLVQNCCTIHVKMKGKSYPSAPIPRQIMNFIYDNFLNEAGTAQI